MNPFVLYPSYHTFAPDASILEYLKILDIENIPSRSNTKCTPNLIHQQVQNLTIEIDKPAYAYGDTLTLRGEVPSVLEAQIVAIQVYNPTNIIYAIAQVVPNTDGTYSTTISIAGSLGIAGVYTVKATYSGQTIQTTFSGVMQDDKDIKWDKMSCK